MLYIRFFSYVCFFLICIYLHGPLKINPLTDVATVLKEVKINQINQIKKPFEFMTQNMGLMRIHDQKLGIDGDLWTKTGVRKHPSPIFGCLHPRGNGMKQFVNVMLISITICKSCLWVLSLFTFEIASIC